MTATDRALAVIGDTFTPERREYQAQILKANQVRELVVDHRYTYRQAMAAMEADESAILDAYEKLMFSNIDLSTKYGRDFQFEKWQMDCWLWLCRITGATTEAA